MRKLTIVQGLQYGSEAKGSVAAVVARNWKPDTTATAWGPNAGHTVRDGDFKFVSTMLASGALYPSVHTILIGPGSVVDILKLAAEVELAGERLKGKYLIIHPQAPFLLPQHAEEEKSLLRIGSTMKGTMAAVVDKMRRLEGTIVRSADLTPLLLVAAKVGLHVSTSEKLYDAAVDDSERLLVEGAQGYSLSIHGQFYPYCTSRDVSTAQLIADCRIPFPVGAEDVGIVGVLRTYPIRVANRKSGDGQEFTSGGFYDDQHELDWEQDMGRPPELTTVTKLPRRIFSFSHEQVYKAIRQIRPTMLALTFCDYIDDPNLARDNLQAGSRTMQLVRAIQATADQTNRSCYVESLSYGPDLSDMFRLLRPTGKLDRHPFSFGE